MRAEDLRLLARDATLTVQGQVERWSSLTMNLRFNTPGAWQLTVPAPSASASLLSAPGAGLLVLYRGETLFSGPVYSRVRSRSAGTSALQVGGPDDKQAAVESRVVEPCDPPYTLQDSDIQAGAAEDVITHYVRRNAGDLARVARVVPGLVVAPSQGRGLPVTWTGRFDPLGDVLRSLTLAGGDLGWDVTQVGASLQFSVFVPRDLTASAQFSEGVENLGDFTLDQKAPKANAVIAGGYGTGTARMFVEVDDAASQEEWGRIETFYNGSSAASTDALTTTATSELTKDADQVTVQFTPLDTAGLRFFDDYRLGDQVTVIIDGVPTSEILREMQVDAQPGKTVSLKPTLASPAASTALAVFQRLAQHGRRLTGVERA